MSAPSDIADHMGHRARLKARFVATHGTGLADYELLELLLMFGIPRQDVKPLAKTLLTRFGSLNGVLSAPADDLRSVKGLGDSTAALLQLVQQLALRTRKEHLSAKPVLSSRLVLLDYLYTRFATTTREELVVLFVDAKLQLLQDETLFTGTLNEVTAAPREILKRALTLNAAGLVVSHNHPSGLPKPSAADHTFTQQLVQAATAVGLQLHDHIIIGTEGHYSFKGAGEL